MDYCYFQYMIHFLQYSQLFLINGSTSLIFLEIFTRDDLIYYITFRVSLVKISKKWEHRIIYM